MDKREGKDQAEHKEENTKGMHRRLMKEVRAGRGKLIMLLVLGAVSACAIAASSWAIANITNEVFLGGAGLDTLYGWFALLFGALVLRGVLSSAEGCQAGRITSSMTAHFRRLLFDALHRGGPAYLSGEDGGACEVRSEVGEDIKKRLTRLRQPLFLRREKSMKNLYTLRVL
jgi:ABC-type multidrug transport system fused ATPase/permease subunit